MFRYIYSTYENIYGNKSPTSKSQPAIYGRPCVKNKLFSDLLSTYKKTSYTLVNELYYYLNHVFAPTDTDERYETFDILVWWNS